MSDHLILSVVYLSYFMACNFGTLFKPEHAILTCDVDYNSECID